jgi:hypothetical protein
MTKRELQTMVAEHMAAHHGWVNTPAWSYTIYEQHDGSLRVIQGSGNNKLGEIRDGVFTVTSPKVLDQTVSIQAARSL